ncbi:hypothetical protein LAZ40_03105 [Cereibacter sphaeroides]|uniref:hypothetical protein n=1 Tax=Cereibacter sphaeroides TaxID=1063 RepID=UPI001F22C768|nr:hypothetical protein [Cereibacter sphaeroides]MCE6958043.1 hypothetical protein [Cereibacter sphaeroides]MCE6971364.1 hypothetical protein [Cereibacter sphaeroides]
MSAAMESGSPDHPTTEGTTGAAIQFQRPRLVITVTISFDWTAEDWSLFDDMEGAEEAAAELNRTLVSAVNGGAARFETQRRMEAAMERLADFGANDSEPRGSLEGLLDRIYRPND